MSSKQQPNVENNADLSLRARYMGLKAVWGQKLRIVTSSSYPKFYELCKRNTASLHTEGSSKFEELPSRPEISVGILVKNGGEAFKLLLLSLLRQKIKESFEVVVLDSGSSDGSLELADSLGAVVHKYAQKEFFFGEARDQLISNCSGKCIVFVSSDAIPTQNNWLHLLTRAVLEQSADIAQGCEPAEYKRFYWERISLFYEIRPWKNFAKRCGSVDYSTVCMAASKNCFDNYSFAPSPSCEDKSFQVWAEQREFRASFIKDACVAHSHEYCLAALYQRCKEEGEGLSYLGERYTFGAMIADILSPKIWAFFVIGLLTFSIRNVSELAYPILRPAAIWLTAYRSRSRYSLHTKSAE